jgi:hypothetical protein
MNSGLLMALVDAFRLLSWRFLLILKAQGVARLVPEVYSLRNGCMRSCRSVHYHCHILSGGSISVISMHPPCPYGKLFWCQVPGSGQLLDLVFIMLPELLRAHGIRHNLNVIRVGV